jgi:site-specific recombinase XerD
VRTRYKGLRRFCRWLLAEGEVDVDPMAGMDVPAVVDKPVPVLDDVELAALLKACQGKTFVDRRDEAVIRFLLDTGCRVSELCGITLDDLDLDHELVIVTGKGRKTRPVYFGARTARAVDRYMRERRGHRYAHSPALFLSQRGPLSPDGVRDILTRRARLAGVTGLNPHRFRHTFAHDFLLAGGQERDLKRLAGWSSDVMLERYGSSAADSRQLRRRRRVTAGSGCWKASGPVAERARGAARREDLSGSRSRLHERPRPGRCHPAASFSGPGLRHEVRRGGDQGCPAPHYRVFDTHLRGSPD